MSGRLDNLGQLIDPDKATEAGRREQERIAEQNRQQTEAWRQEREARREAGKPFRRGMD